MEKCKIYECERDTLTRGFCSMHYQRFLNSDWFKSTRTIGMSMKAKLKFYSKHNTETGCIEWTGLKNSNGYGIITVNGKPKYSHRESYELNVSDIPDGLCVLHKCDVPACINHKHLFIGTMADNVRDMISKGRDKKAQGSSNYCSKFTEDEVINIRARLGDGESRTVIAKEFNVHYNTIMCIDIRKTWTHI